MVKLCHINRSGPVFWDTLYLKRKSIARSLYDSWASCISISET